MTEQRRSSKSGAFVTPERLALEEGVGTGEPRGRLLIAGCCSGSYLSREVAKRYRALVRESGSREDVLELEDIDKRFSDSETCVRLDLHVSGSDAFLFQTTLDPTSDRSVDQNYMAFLIAARALREHGAAHVTGVLPYLAYARQDKPTKFTREPTTARLLADLSIAAGIDRLIVWDPHCGQIRGFYGAMPVNMLESLTLFLQEFERFRGRDDVVAVAPDAGASKFVTHFGRALGVKCAIASKYRPRPEEVIISEIIGDFEGKRIAVILDDMISGGGTIYALIRKLVDEKGIEEVYLGVSHNLCVGRACERLSSLHSDYGLKEVVVTNSIPQTDQFLSLSFVSVKCLSEALVQTINRIHYERSVSEVFYRPD
ncbi:MAG: ribose-phosphate pyrophosphokinase [Candidatus Eisenbacteria sp.]|nr:ribose-phosphate pyrophosphokinase [Candidatus Eisenbacteria bacterium]